MHTLPCMAASRHTESPFGLESQERDADLSTNPAPAVSIEEGIKATLARLRSEFADLREKVKALPTDHPDRLTHGRMARIVGRRISDCQSILDRRHWREEEGKKKRGRPSKRKEVEG